MQAFVLERPGARLSAAELPAPELGEQDVLLRVEACGVCRTDLHVLDGELPTPKGTLVLGHEIVGRVVGRGERVTRFELGARVGVPWLGWACGACDACRSGRENLCPRARFTGYTRDGGYAELAAADARFCFRLPTDRPAAELAPFLCAGFIGHRALRLAGAGPRVGLYGFGAAAHLVAQVAVGQGRQVFAFVRPGDDDAARFALQRVATWAGPSDRPGPVPLDCAILFAPVGALVPAALRAVAPGGTVVCAGIHMSDIPSFPYRDLWQERVLRSVANLTRADGEEFLALAQRFHVRAHVEVLPLREAMTALQRLRRGDVQGALVLAPS